ILVLGGLVPEALAAAVDADLELTLADRALLAPLRRAALQLGKPAVVHLKLDTGLTRYGAPADEVEALAAAAEGDPAFRIQGLFTHFATADEPEDGYFQEQLERFQRTIRRLERCGHVIPHYHAANTAATLRTRAAHFDLVR